MFGTWRRPFAGAGHRAAGAHGIDALLDADLNDQAERLARAMTDNGQITAYVNQLGLNVGAPRERRWRTLMAYYEQCPEADVSRSNTDAVLQLGSVLVWRCADEALRYRPDCLLGRLVCVDQLFVSLDRGGEVPQKWAKAGKVDRISLPSDDRVHMTTSVLT